MIDFKIKVVDLLDSLSLNLSREEIYNLVEIPPDTNLGDYAFPTFKLAKEFRKAPNLISEDLANKLEANEYISEIKNVGPYVNFFISVDALKETVINEVIEDEKFGSNNSGEGKNMVVEFSSTNIAKPFHIGHIRSTVIGNAINNILKYENYNTTSVNYLGDYGTQFGIMISAYRKWGNDEAIKENPIEELLNLYVKYNKLAKEDESLMDEARHWFDELEKENPEAVELWQWFKEISLNEFQRVYKLLGVDFDSFNGEAFHSQFMPDVIKELDEKNLLVDSEGAVIVNLEKYDLPPVIIKKSNGSSTYMTRDIATAIYRHKTYDFNKNIYVVATQQLLHFKQLKAVLQEMGYEWYDDCVHVPFGMISMKDGAMRTREGKVVFLEDVLNKAIDKTKEIIEQRNPNLENKDEVARSVGVGAIIFQDLFNNRIKDYVFDWDQVLNFEGETGPYVQYSYARSCAILNKGEFDLNKKADLSLLKETEEIDLVKLLYRFPSVIEDAADRFEPSYITRYVVELAKLFNRFYNACPIHSSSDDIKQARLLLTYSVNKVLGIGLSLLGIDAPEKM